MASDGPARRQLALELGHDAQHGEADFLVGEGNALAHGRVLAWPNWPDPITLLIGPAKSGKSHLARIFADRSGAEMLPPDVVERAAATGGREPLIVEDADQAGHDEAALFHLINQSMRDGRSLLITARDEVAQWPLATDDVRSRLRRAATFRLEITGDIQLSQMFVKLFADRQVAVDPKVIGYIVARMERSAEEAVILADLMDRLALERGTAITRSIASEALDRRQPADGDTADWDTSDDE
jgi:chromosomal replication initiation ATPase DnaA